MKTNGSFSPIKWDENTVDQISATKKITKASVVLDFGTEGPIAGKASVEWLMYYNYADEKDQHRSSAAYLGLLRFDGSLDGKQGSFVMEDRGTFDGGRLSAALTILDGSGTGELAGITGSAKYEAAGAHVAFELDYEL